MKHLRFLSTGAVLKEGDERAAELVAKGTHAYISATEYREKQAESTEKFMLGAVVAPQHKTITVKYPIKSFVRLRAHLLGADDAVERLVVRLLDEYVEKREREHAKAFDYRATRKLDEHA